MISAGDGTEHSNNLLSFYRAKHMKLIFALLLLIVTSMSYANDLPPNSHPSVSKLDIMISAGDGTEHSNNLLSFYRAKHMKLIFALLLLIVTSMSYANDLPPNSHQYFWNWLGL